MKPVIHFVAWASCLLSIANMAWGDVLAYPTKGQSAKQQQKDHYECDQWAKKKTGIDPQAMAGTAPPPTEEPRKGGAARGAARRRKSEKQEKESQAQAQAQQKQQLTAFNDAQSVYLKGRGYSVK